MVKPSVILGTESWLEADIGDNEVFPDGYTCYRKDRNAHGGGVFILVENSIYSSEVYVGTGACEAIFCQLIFSNNKILTACSFYRPPDSPVDAMTQLIAMTEAVQTDCVVIGGDFNLPNIVWSKQGRAIATAGRLNQEMANLTDLFALRQMVMEPTRGSNILDLLLTNQPHLVRSTMVVPGISDHSGVICQMNVEHVKTSRGVARRVYNFEKADVNRINEGLNAYYTVFETEAEYKGASELWLSLKDKICELRQRFVPSRILTTREGRSKPWFSRALRSLTRKRQRLYRNYCITPTVVNCEKLKKVACELKTAICIAKDTFTNSIELRLKDNPKEFWKHVKRNGKDVLDIPPLISSDVIVHDDIAKAETFNQYFSSVFTTVIPSDDGDTQAIREGIGDMNDIVISERGIESLLQGLNTSKAGGPDGLPNHIFKLCARSLSPFLKIVFMKSLNEACLPDDWKNAAVVPIHKSGPRNDVANYRPISLTCVACKVLEHILYSSIVEHMNRYCLFNPRQHGFRRGLSCVTQLTEFTHDLAYALDRRLSIDCVFLDFRKAFDTVPHSLLIGKLNSYNINPQVVSWVSEYLRQRSQFVVVSGSQSSAVQVTSGVPQGSVLGPLLFLLYINDITEGVVSQMRLFADDCVLYGAVACVEDANIIQRDLDRINQWCLRWCMQLNLGKTVFMSFTRKKNPYAASYAINNNILSRVLEYKYLGVNYTTDLRWNTHVDYVVAKAGKTLGFLRRNARNFNKDTRELLYKAYVRSVIEYACVVWDPPTARDKIKLERLQNLAARFVTGNYSRDFSATRTKDILKWELLETRRRRLRLKLFHNIYHSTVGIQRDMYIIRPHYQSERVDHSFKVREISFKTEVFRMSFFPRTIYEWNRLPQSLVGVLSNDDFFSLLN